MSKTKKTTIEWFGPSDSIFTTAFNSGEFAGIKSMAEPGSTLTSVSILALSAARSDKDAP